jgi:hypothetical protein
VARLFSEDELAFLTRPHIARAWFLSLELPSGVSYLHSGVGRVTIDGQEWLGVSDPLSGRLVSLTQVEEPQFGAAAAVTIVLSGASRDFIASVHATARQIEGRSADLYWAAFDGETQTIWSAGLKKLFARGRMTSPSIQWQGIGVRTVSLTIENIFQAQNFAPGGRWTDADQKRRWPGDEGLEYIGVEISEQWA